MNSQPVVITSPNTNVTVTVEISNLGTQAATNVQVQVQLDGAVYTNLQVNVGADASTQTSFTWVSTVGSHHFQITIDPNDLINDTNRANNVATFNINVGPTLTINVPLNVTASNSTLWVAINGVKYNVTSGQLQTSVPVGNVTVQVQPVVNTTQGVRAQFSGWSDGSLAKPAKYHHNLEHRSPSRLRHRILAFNNLQRGHHYAERLVSTTNNRRRHRSESV